LPKIYNDDDVFLREFWKLFNYDQVGDYSIGTQTAKRRFESANSKFAVIKGLLPSFKPHSIAPYGRHWPWDILEVGGGDLLLSDLIYSHYLGDGNLNYTNYDENLLMNDPRLTQKIKTKLATEGWYKLLRPNSLDMVVMVNVAHHISDFGLLLPYIHNALREDGVVIFYDHSVDNYERANLLEFKHLLYERGLRKVPMTCLRKEYRDANGWNRVFTSAGFKLEKKKRVIKTDLEDICFLFKKSARVLNIPYTLGANSCGGYVVQVLNMLLSAALLRDGFQYTQKRLELVVTTGKGFDMDKFIDHCLEQEYLFECVPSGDEKKI